MSAFRSFVASLCGLAGFATLLLYKRDGNRFVAATNKPLGDLAWEYFFT